MSLKSYFFGLAVGAWLGACGTMTFYPAAPPQALRSPRALIASPTMVQEIKAYPVNIELRIMDAKTFDKDAKMQFSEVLKNGGRILGFTRPDHDPCVIVMPDDFKIRFMPDVGYAMFRDPMDADTLAHEILHCLYSDWHKPWSSK
jgi:hypothetical protein